jgi:hypothetical protein
MSPRPGFRRDGALIALLAGTAWLLLGQNLIHGFDAYVYLRRVAAGDLHHELHALYLPTAWAWSKALAVLDVPQYEAMRALSAFAGAIGVFACHRAAVRLHLPRERAAMVACAAASLPALWHSATVVEIDAIAFATHAVAWMPFAMLVRDGVWRAAVATGVATGVAAAFHGSGNLFAASLCGLLLLWQWPVRWRLVLGGGALLVLAHVVTALAITRAIGADAQHQMVTNTLGHSFRSELVPAVLLHEVLLPYAPFCALALLAARARDLRALAAGFAICLAVYVVVTVCVLGHFREEARFGPQGRSTERGSFLLGLALPMVLLTVQALPRRLAWAAIAVAFASAVAQQRLLDWPDDPPGYAAAWARLDAERPVHTIFASAQEWAWVARRHPGVRGTFVGGIERQCEVAAANGGVPVPSDFVVMWLAGEIDAHERAGRRLLLTEGARAALRASAQPGIARAAAELDRWFVLEPVAEGPLRGWWLRRR